MKNVLTIIVLIFCIYNSLVARGDSLKIKLTDPINPDSLTIKNKLVANDTISTNDTLGLGKDSLKAQKQRPLVPLFPKGLLTQYEFGTILNRNQLLFSDYRFTGDFINLFPLGFIRDLGIAGQPHEVLVYGSGFNNVSYMQDGITLNNRFTNAFDLNNMQSESIDSIEVIPSVRGFLYGNSINPVSVNFISKNDFNIEGKRGAYSRMRYYQAPNEEAFIDVIFKTNITQRFISTFEITNSSVADQFPNSNYGSWKGNVKLNYLLSDNFNLVGNYNYVKSEVHLFGGLDLDSLSKMTNPPANDLGSPVKNYTQYEKTTGHNTYLKLLNKLSTKISGELTTYYNYNLIEFRQNEYKTTSEEYIFRDHTIKTLGGTLREVYEDSNFDADFIANYEKVFVRSGFVSNGKQFNSASLSGKLSLKLNNNKFIPSVFGKYLYFIDQSLYGIGGDVTVNLSNSFSLYGGVSYFQKPFNIYQSEVYSYKNITVTSCEFGFKASLENDQTSLIFFYRKINNEPYQYLPGHESLLMYNSNNSEIYGAGINLSVYFGKIFLEGKSAYYLNKFNDKQNYLVPEYTFNGGIFYKDVLFNSNLNLKTGLSINAIGIQNIYSYDFETNNFYGVPPFLLNTNYPYKSKLNPSLVFNFLLIGEIQKRAIIYFTFENLLDKEYYIVPYYRKQGRGMRLGVAWEFLN